MSNQTSIRVLIIDDSAFVRKVVREMLSSCGEIEVVGMARNGQDGLQMVEELRPEVVTCDLNMPEMNGIAFVREQMTRKPLPILILSASPQDGESVLAALEAGAVDFIQKPSALANENLLSTREELVEKVKASARTPLSTFPGVGSSTPVLIPAPASSANFDVVVLGISTGGPQALRYLIPQFAANFPVPLVMVLHMPVGYTAIFAEKLAELSKLKVREGFEGCPVQAGEAVLAPAGRHSTFRRDADGKISIHLSVQPIEKPHRPSVDVLFQSAAETYGSRVLGVVMTGMGDDGREGAAGIKARGGMVLTESERSCIIYGMPRSVVEAGLSDGAFELRSMAAEISKRL